MTPEDVKRVCDERVEKVRSEYQRFYDFVADNDPALVDAWHFGENVRVQQEAREEHD